MNPILGIAVVIMWVATSPLYAAKEIYCGEIKLGSTGGDYTNSEDKANKLGVVEGYHFTAEVEKLISGTSGTLGADIGYTLDHFPNHHRALAAMGKLGLRDKVKKAAGAKYSVECYFERAIRFKPTDGMVRMVYGDYLLKTGRSHEAREQLQIAADLQPEDPTINYNVGLLYLKQKDYERARTYAKKAYDLGFPLPGLKNQLKQAGKWDE